MTSSNNKKLIERLDEEKKRGLSPRFFSFFRKLTQLQAEVQQKTASVKPALKKSDIDARLQNGIPLLDYSDLILDWPLLNDTYAKISGIFSEYADLFSEALNGTGLPGSPKMLSREIVKAWFNEEELPAGLPEDNASGYLLLETMIHAALKPFLISHSKALIDSINQEDWRRLKCPICGGNPDISYLESEYGARWLVCSRCDTEWLFQRLQCPYCANLNQNELAFFSDENDIYRLYVCEHCHSYIKTIDLRKAKSEVFIPLERILTLDMDRQAHDMGYHPGHFTDLPDSTE